MRPCKKINLKNKTIELIKKIYKLDFELWNTINGKYKKIKVSL